MEHTVKDENVNNSDAPARMFIYGSCVTRDCMPFLGDEVELLHYTARQSLLSAGSDPLEIDDAEIALGSAFQQRQVRGDLESSLFSDLEAHAKQADILIMDIVDERLGVRSFRGSYVTISAELSKTPLMAAVRAEGSMLSLGDDKHFLLYARGVVRLARALNHLNAIDKCLVFDTPWATKSSDGSEVEPFRDIPTEEMNAKMRRYYDYLATAGIKVVRAPDELIVADANHQWGVAPFHYVPAFYDWMSQVIREHIAKVQQHRAQG